MRGSFFAAILSLPDLECTTELYTLGRSKTGAGLGASRYLVHLISCDHATQLTSQILQRHQSARAVRGNFGTEPLGLICSVSCSGSVVIKTYDAIRELRAAGIIVAGGFHSPMEHECLDLLLRGVQPVVLCPAYGIEWLSLDPQQQAAVDSGRLLVLSIFGVEAMRATPALALRRIEFVAALAAAVFVPPPAPGGKAEATARQAIARGQEVLTFDVKENTNLIELCAKPVDVRELVAPHVNDQHIRVE